MIRLANDINGFFDGNNTNMKCISHSKYPKQNTRYIGKWTALRFKSEYNDIPPYIAYTDGFEDIFKRGDKYYFDIGAKKPVPEKYRDGTDRVITEVIVNKSINNRHIIDRRYYPSVTISNSGVTTLFQILRYDSEYPNKVILRSKNNEVIVMTSEEFLKIYDLIGSDMVKRIKRIASSSGVEYISPSLTNNKDLFFEYYNNEKINIYPIQNEELIGMNIYTEYELDVLDKELSFEDNKMDKYTLKDKNLDRVIVDNDGVYKYLDNINDTVDEKDYPISDKYNNRFEFTKRMKKNLVANDSDLKGFPDTTLQSYSQTYDVHLKDTTIDTPIRAINRGVIIRADMSSSDTPYIVAAEYTDDGLRIICSDEARFFFNSADFHHLLSKTEINDIFNNYDLIK